jgi:hemoglobin
MSLAFRARKRRAGCIPRLEIGLLECYRSAHCPKPEDLMPKSAPHSRVLALVATLALIPLFACARGDTNATDTAAGAAATDTAQRTLYDRLGGRDAIVTVVDSFVARVAADNRINKKFARSNVPRVKTMLVEQICNATGGPCTYRGRSMKEAHRNMGVTDGEFDALVEDLVATLNQFNVAKADQDALLNTLGSMRADIVERPGPETGGALPASFRPAPPLSQDTARR